MGVKINSQDRLRRTGRTTAIALQIIAEAIRNPHQWRQVRDHGVGVTLRQEEYVFDLIKEMTYTLGYQFEFRKLTSRFEVRSMYLGYIDNGFDTRPATLKDHGYDK